MNLVAKEFVSSRFDEDGVLLLSQFAGSALELGDAMLFNPYAVDELSEAMHQALTMKRSERRRRMRRMRAAVAENNVYRWAGKILSALLKLDTAESLDAVRQPVPHFLRRSHEPVPSLTPELRTEVALRPTAASAF
jgi:trehalose 6-phosphate synthase